MNKIALIGDIHFGKFSRSNEFSIPGEKLQDMTVGAASIKEGLIEILRKQSVNSIFIAGDLTSTGNPIEYDCCYEIIKNIAESANISFSNIVICFGNHDVDWKISEIGKVIENENTNTLYPIDKLKKYYQNIAASVGDHCLTRNSFTEIGPAPFSGLLKKKGINIFVLNTGWLCAKDDIISHGKLEKKQLEWFREQAKNVNEEKVWKVILLHHHPINYPYPKIFHETSLLEEGSELIEIAGENGFHLVCHGHRHHPKAYNEFRDGWKNPITFICTGSFSVNSQHRSNGEIPNCFHILEIIDDDKRIIRLQTYEYKSSDGWKKIEKNCKETPLDGDMFFCKPYTEEERKLILHTLIKNFGDINEFEMPVWNKLPIELKTLTYQALNELINNTYGKLYQVYGIYPEKVCLVRKKT